MPSPTQPASPPPSAPPAPPQGGWIGPDRISTRDYDEFSLIIDSAGVAHAVAVSDGIFYLTNGSGSWTRQRLSTPLGTGDKRGVDNSPSIALDRHDGSLSVAFVRYRRVECELFCFPRDPQGIFVVGNRESSWSEPVRVADGQARGPSLQASGGVLHLAYENWTSGDAAVHYMHTGGGAWLDARVADQGWEPTLRLHADGTPVIGFGGGEGLYLATAAEGEGSFTVEHLPLAAGGASPILAVDEEDRPHIAYYDWSDGGSGALYTTRQADGWRKPEPIFPGARATIPYDETYDVLPYPADIAVAGGVVHVMSENSFENSGLWYASSAGGSFAPRQLSDPLGCADCLGATSAVAVDESGRPHILFATADDAAGLWYGIGPAE